MTTKDLIPNKALKAASLAALDLQRRHAAS
jgi:hypothetical protein